MSSSLFDDIALEDREMLTILNIGRQKLNKNLKTLMDKGFITKVKASPSIHSISEEVKNII